MKTGMSTYLFRKMHSNESLLNACFEDFPSRSWSLTSTVKAHGVESGHVNHPAPNNLAPNNLAPNNLAPNNLAPNNLARKALR